MADYVRLHPERTRFFPSLGQAAYFSAVRLADAVIGNSSSGIIEAPALGTPTVNVGDRQKGRARGGSVIDCEEEALSVKRAIERVLDGDFSKTPSPYGGGGTARRMKEILATTDLAELDRKGFHDISK
jgi:UDP-N-acetylglucosamine 2-epimerase